MIATAVFDAYGTLFDVSSAARAFATRPEGARLGDWAEVAADWRDRQLQYAWLRAIAGAHAPFDQVTADALDWVLEARGLSDAGLRAPLLALYDRLEAYPEVPGVLDALRDGGTRTAILSNGTPAMLAAAVDAAGLGARLDAVLSVEDLPRPVYKPHPSVYRMVGERLGTEVGEVLFVSSNGWDVTHAAAFGFRTAWVNRTGAPGDRVGMPPDHVIPDLAPIPGLAR